MKKLFFVVGLLMILAGIGLNYKEELLTIYHDLAIYLGIEDVQLEKNEYYRDYDFRYVQNTNDFVPYSFDDLINIFYTIINSGQESFKFHCPDEYETCIDDVKMLIDDEVLLSHVNDFVHPYNSFKKLTIDCYSNGFVELMVKRGYKQEEIDRINVEVDKIFNTIIKPGSSDIEKIRTIHDYIINNTKYDSDRVEREIYKYKSDIAYGPLFEGFGICGGYTETMQLFLEKLGIKNYRVSSEDHVWNAVYLDGVWYHLDLTWDDPIMDDNSDMLDDHYFLISTKKLQNLDQEKHNFDQMIYLELKAN